MILSVVERLTHTTVRAVMGSGVPTSDAATLARPEPEPAGREALFLCLVEGEWEASRRERE
jgi:hypothetical protein